MNNIEMPQVPSPEKIVDLSNVEVITLSEEQIKAYFENKLRELDNPQEYLKENNWKFDFYKKRAPSNVPEEQLVGMFINNEKGKYGNAVEKTIAVKKIIEKNLDLIRSKVQEHLAQFLPDWTPEKVIIEFKLLDRSDFIHPNKGKVEVDLYRLSFEQDPIKTSIDGITHELFHEWMSGSNLAREWNIGNNRESISVEKLHLKARYKVVDEGLAVLLGGQSLSEHHHKSEAEYRELVRTSFDFINNLLKIENVAELEKKIDEGYSNMGPTYIVGNEMANVILKRRGQEHFNKMIESIRSNPEIFFEEYEKLCEEDDKLINIFQI